MKRIFLAACVLAGLVLPVAAQNVQDTASQTGRYQMQPVEGGVTRLDTKTGAVSFCRVEQQHMVCDADSATPSIRQEVDQLAARVESLEERMRQPGGRIGRDKEQQLDEAMDQMKQIFRSFHDMIDEWRREERGSGAEGDSGPNRT